eukprot:TRINITY_DN1102_c0_g1_i3.p1 TRINITY_DN1102_c0_g1~~TRINITY_DN1102_c0_g1_i3.p1  ORF type:complete len:174 (+),score=20.90 TRINITY_DN1102_c0_g1_i3:233-754(+)
MSHNICQNSKKDWGNVSFLHNERDQFPVATIWLNPVLTTLLKDCKTDVFQTIYPDDICAPETVLGTAEFERPIMNKKVVKGVQQLRQFQGQDNIWYCGAHAAYGIPLLENAVKSSVWVARQLGAEIPWNATDTPVYPPKLDGSKQTNKQTLNTYMYIFFTLMGYFLIKSLFTK